MGKKKEVELLQQKAESPKVSKKIKQEIEDMKTVMIGQNRQIIEMEEKLKENLKEESNRKKEMVRKEKELKKIKAELEAKNSADSTKLKKQNDDFKKIVSDKTKEVVDLKSQI